MEHLPERNSEPPDEYRPTPSWGGKMIWEECEYCRGDGCVVCDGDGGKWFEDMPEDDDD